MRGYRSPLRKTAKRAPRKRTVYVRSYCRRGAKEAKAARQAVTRAMPF